MKIKKLTGSPIDGFNQFTNSGGGGTLTGPLILSSDPTLPLQATTKGYIDTALNAIPMTKVVSGTMIVDRFPGFNGDVIKNVGAASISLAPTGVGAGSYTKYSVDGKGRITTAATLVDTDMPSISWNKIVTGKVSSIANYGITDAVSKAGDTLTGFLTLTSNPTAPTHTANKAYVDSVAAASLYSIGDVYVRPMNITPNGFLRANGSFLDKTTYSALYTVVGDTFTPISQPGNGQPWRLQYDINTTQSSDITNWSTGTSLPVTVFRGCAFVTKNRAYLIGGQVNGSPSSTVYSAPINADGTLGTWATETAFPVTLTQSHVVVTKNKVHILGGLANGASSSAVYTAPINTDGTIGVWTTGVALPATIVVSQAVVILNKVYLIGGVVNSAASAAVHSATIDADGTIGSWTTGGSLPGILAYSQAVVTKSKVYMLGGNLSGVRTNAVHSAPINEDGSLGTWITDVALPSTVSFSHSVITKNRVYLIGGSVDGPVSSTILTAPINADGTLGVWAVGTPLPNTLTYSHAIIVLNKVYLLGGRVDSQLSSVVHVGVISGGLNDYSEYYNGSYTVNNTSKFRLPDFSSKETSTQFYYIKY